MINKKGQSLGLSIMSAIAILLVGFLCLNFIPDEVARGLTDLNCDATDDIEDGNKLLCLAEYIIVPYYIWIIVSIAISAIIARFVF